MVFVALMNAILTGEILLSSLAMAAFGLGTLPSMLTVTFAANKMNATVRAKMNRAVPYLITVVGIMIVLRGMNLNIPYISPGVTTVEQPADAPQDAEPQVEMNCCHSKEECD
jgi:sulfite exporter TauE/SafE